jgi:hypothetical protein
VDTSYSYQDSLHFLNESEWNKLTVQNKAAVMQSVENEVARREGRPPCNVSLYNEPPKEGKLSAGWYNRENDSIGMNSYHLNGKADACLNTILHEGRHAYQERAVKGNICYHNQDELKSWRNNMKPGFYINPEQNRRAYYKQPIEADAREYAAITSRQIQAEQKIQNSNKGIGSFREKSGTTQEAGSSINRGIQAFRDKTNRTESGSTPKESTAAKSESSGQSSGDGQRR